MKYLIKQGTEVFIVSAIAASITGVIAGVSFVSKYYMLNEDYSYNPVIEDIMTAHAFLNTIESEHSQTKYVDSIRFVNGKWITNFKEIELPPEPVIEEKTVNPVIEDSQQATEDPVKNVIVEDTSETKPIISEQVNVEDINNSIPDVNVATIETVPNSDSVEDVDAVNQAEDVKKDGSFDPFEEKDVLKTNDNLLEKKMASDSSDEFAIPVEPSLTTDEMVKKPVEVEPIIQSEIIESVEKVTEDKEEAVLEETTIEDDSFEIIDAADIKSLDLTNISEDDIVLE